MKETLIAHNFASAIEAKFLELADKKGLSNVLPVLSMLVIDPDDKRMESSLRFYYRFEIENWLDLSDSEIGKIAGSARPCVKALKRLLTTLSKKYFECPVKIDFRVDESNKYGTILVKIELKW